MASGSDLDVEEELLGQTPRFFIGQHDSERTENLTDSQYSQVLEAGFDFVTTPITNINFRARVVDLYRTHLKEREAWGKERHLSAHERSNKSLPGPVVSALTDNDTSLFPSTYISSPFAYSSPWVNLCSPDPIISSISRQVLNLEVAYADFCGVSSIFIPGPRQDDRDQVATYARAIQESLQVAVRANIVVHLPMYREPGLEESAGTLATLVNPNGDGEPDSKEEIDLFSSWDTWHTIRSVCSYSTRLFVSLRIPRRLPVDELQDRWFCEPLHFLTFGPKAFQENRAGHPCLSRTHQKMVNKYMSLKNTPWVVLYDVGPDVHGLNGLDTLTINFPTLAEAKEISKENKKPNMSKINDHASYMRYLQRQQPTTAVEITTLTNFQDWLQSPLQPLSDNLESATYEVFERDPVKYDRYELAIATAMAEWKGLNKPTSSGQTDGGQQDLIVAVAGAGRGPLVTRVLKAAENTGTPIQLWALEKNQNAYVYLLRENQRMWGDKVTVVRTDMRDWEGPRRGGEKNGITKVDILVTELLGSFGDNELSPECLDGIQRHIARPHGISIPQSYTAHLTPIATPRLHADLLGRVVGGDQHAFETPWVVRLFAFNFVCQQAPDQPRFQQAWEFAHPVAVSRLDDHLLGGGSGAGARLRTGGGGAMAGSGGTNEHNARHCRLTFVCRERGVIHGLAGYFEATLYASQTGTGEKVELSTLPDHIERKSKDMVSWFPILFPLKQPLYFPPDTELEVSMWRQTDDTKVWYEWMVEAFMWTGPKTRFKVGASELHSSRKVACLM